MQRFRVFSDLMPLDLVGDPHHVVVCANRGESQPPLGDEGVFDHIAVRHHQVFLTAARACDGKINARFVHRDDLPLNFRHLEWIVVRDRILIRGKTMREPRPSDAPDKRDEESRIESRFRGEVSGYSENRRSTIAICSITTLVSRKAKSNQTDDNRRHIEKIAWRDASMQQ
jgi:hypothetical protein